MRSIWKWFSRVALLSFIAIVGSNVLLPAVARAQFAASGGATSLQVLAALVGQAVTADHYVATATTGVGFTCNSVLSSGCIDLGPGANNNIGTDGSGNLILGIGGNPTVNFGTTGNVSILGNGGITSTNTVLNSFNNNYITNTAANKPVQFDDADGIQVVPKAYANIPTCGTVPEGTIWIRLAAGGVETVFCVCTKDAAAAFKWGSVNFTTGVVALGTTTTCGP